MLDLPLNPFPSPALPAIKVAKAQLDLPLVKPRQARYGDARVVATEAPDFLCEYALIGNDMEGTEAALQWAVGGGDDYRAKGFADLLSVWMGGEVRELESEGPRVVFR